MAFFINLKHYRRIRSLKRKRRQTNTTLLQGIYSLNEKKPELKMAIVLPKSFNLSSQMMAEEIAEKQEATMVYGSLEVTKTFCRSTINSINGQIESGECFEFGQIRRWGKLWRWTFECQPKGIKTCQNGATFMYHRLLCRGGTLCCNEIHRNLDTVPKCRYTNAINEETRTIKLTKNSWKYFVICQSFNDENSKWAKNIEDKQEGTPNKTSKHFRADREIHLRGNLKHLHYWYGMCNINFMFTHFTWACESHLLWDQCLMMYI